MAAKGKGGGKSKNQEEQQILDASTTEDGAEEQIDFIDDDEGGFRYEDIYIPPAPRPTCSLDSTAPRLIITHIQNENFKSYAGVQVIGPLHKSFTSIVGPNGSGKSNVIDSMLFVFGYRASKIRSKKISVLLHNSEQHPNVKSCTVTVNFQLLIDKPGEDFELVENSKIAVSRTAFKDNSSFYTINGRKVHFKEVAKLLRNHGIDLDHNRFLILQGEVEQIAMMKPIAPNEHEGGMLEFLEDIIGTSRFKEPLKKLFSRVETLAEERADKLARVKIVEDEKLALEEVKNEAIQFLEIENEITEAQNLLYQRYLMDQEIVLKAEEEKTIDIRNEMDELKAKLGEIQSKKEEKTKEYEEGNKYLEDLHAKHEKIKAEFDKVSNRDMTLQEDIVQCSAKRKKTKVELKQENAKLIELQGIPAKNTKSIEELVKREEKLSKDLEKEVAAKDKLMKGLAAETRVLKDDKETQESKLVGLKAKVDEAKAPNNISKKELEIYLSNEQKQQAKLEQITINLEQCTEKIRSHKPRIKELTAEIPQMEKELEKVQGEIHAVRDEEKASSEELRSLRMNVEETKSSMNASRSRGRVLDFLMRLKAEGSLPGIYGRLGDLGAIDKKYDIAVSTACGVLDHIIVDSKDTGKECVRLLKQHDVGRATFLMLEEQNHLQQYCDSKRQYPENVLRLFDLIKIPDQKFRTAFYYGCRETLVANDLTQATRIGYGRERFRVVTLNGETIEIAGTMSGGGRPSSGRMGQSVAAAATTSPAQIEAMERNLAELEARNNELRHKYRSLDDQLKQLPNKIKGKKIEVGRLKTEVQSAMEQEPALKEQLARQKEKVREAAPDPKEVKRLEAAVAETRKALDIASEAAEKVNSKVKELHAKIMEVTGGRVTAAQKKVNDINQQVEKVRQDMTRLNVAIKTSERNAKKSAEKIQNMEQEVTAAEENMLKMKDEIEDISAKGKVMMAETTACNNEIVKKTEETVKQKQVIADILKEENEAKSLKLEVQGKIDQFTKAYNLQKEKLKGTRKNIQSLKLNKIPGKEVCLELKEFTPEELNENTIEYLARCVTDKESMKSGKKPNLAAIEEYRAIEIQWNIRMEELEQINRRRIDMREIFDDCRKKRHTEFIAGYNIITSKLKEMYQMITLGGDAELELVDSLDPFSEGVVFSVRPPKKSWKNIANLSGGEKTLSSLALVFALHFYKPSPLYVMDEIDAALDFKNVSIVGNYIKERTKNAQFIIISLRVSMFELADRLVGIYKTYNATKSCVINPRLYGRQGIVLDAADAIVVCNDVNITAVVNNLNEVFEALKDQPNTNRNVLAANNSPEKRAPSISPGHGKKVPRPAEFADPVDRNTNRNVLAANNSPEKRAPSISPGHGKKVPRPAEFADPVDRPLEKRRKEDMLA